MGARAIEAGALSIRALEVSRWDGGGVNLRAMGFQWSPETGILGMGSVFSDRMGAGMFKRPTCRNERALPLSMRS